MTGEIKTCACGRRFATSRTGSTVRCPECRAPKAKRAAVRAPRVVAAAGRTCTIVVTGEGDKCGKPAVFAFEASTGEVFAECAGCHR